MDWITLHYESIKRKVVEAETVEVARDVHRDMTIRLELDSGEDILIQKAKHIYATKIKGERV